MRLCESARWGIGRAFTILELLVVIVILAALVGILLPVLGAARDGAKHTQRLSWGHQLGIATQMYTRDFDGVYPYLGVQRSGDGPVSFRGIELSKRPFYNRYFWINGVAEAYLDGGLVVPWTINGGPERGIFSHVREGVLVSGWTLTATTCAEPSFWRSDAPIFESSLRAMGDHDVRYPGQKVLITRAIDVTSASVCKLYNEGRLDINADREVVFADGSSIGYDPNLFMPTFAEGRPSAWGALAMPIDSTIEGVAGIDRK